MRSFLTFKNITVHTYVEYYTQECAVNQGCAASITNKGQWHTHYGHQANDHADVDYNLPEEIKEYSGYQGAAKTILGITHRINDPQHEQTEQG